MNPFHTFPPCFPKSHSNIILPSTSSSSACSPPFRFSDQNFVCVSHFFLACCIPRLKVKESYKILLKLSWKDILRMCIINVLFKLRYERAYFGMCPVSEEDKKWILWKPWRVNGRIIQLTARQSTWQKYGVEFRMVGTCTAETTGRSIPEYGGWCRELPRRTIMCSHALHIQPWRSVTSSQARQQRMELRPHSSGCGKSVVL